jgi:hypothetical protein
MPIERFLRSGQQQRMTKFAKGMSGNPGGRPKAVAVVRELAQAETAANVRALVAIRDDLTAPHAARIAAVHELNDRAFGKPTQPFAGDGDRDTVRFVIQGSGDGRGED